MTMKLEFARVKPAMGTAVVALAILQALWTCGGCSAERPSFSIPVISPGRAGHTQVILSDGRILIIGGWVSSPQDPEGFALTGSAFTISPTTGSIREVGALAFKRQSQTSTLLRDGRVLVAGGQSRVPYLIAMDQAEIYDPETDRFEPVAQSMARARHTHTATLLPDGRVFLAGGDGPYVDQVHSGCEVFDPETGSFLPAGDMAHCRTGHMAILLASGRVLIAGGATWVGPRVIYPTDVELFDPGTASSSLGEASFPIPLSYKDAALKLPSGKVLTISTLLSAAALYDPDTALFEEVAGYRHPRYGASYTVLEDTGEVFVIGGYEPKSPLSPVLEIERFDPAAKAFVEWGILPRARSFHTASRLPDGRILLVGGREPGGAMIGPCEVVDPRRAGL